MLVMAIEAARQLADENRCISGYALSDVRFLKPILSASNAKDFELQVYLRGCGSYDDDPSASKEFSVHTVDNGNWAENCRGNITVEYMEGTNDIDNGKEAREEAQHLGALYETADMTCTRKVPPKNLYENLKSIGIEYGPTFQVLENISSGNHDAIAHLKLGLWAMEISRDRYQEHVIHPSELDGILQLSFPALQGKSDRWLPTLVPERMQYMWISSRGLRNPTDTHARAHAKVNIVTSRGAELSMTAMASGTDELRVDIRGFMTTNLQTQESRKGARKTEWRRLCFNFDWRPDLQLLDPQQLLDHCKPTLGTAIVNSTPASDVEYVCYTTILNTLEHTDHNLVTTIDQPHLTKYLDWMKLQTQRYNQGKLVHWRPDWVTLRKDSNYTERIVTRVRDSSAAGRLYARVATNISNVLEGRVDALELLFGNSLAADFYYEMAAVQLDPLRPFVDALAHKNPGLKILEIGAGTGGSTLPLLNMLQPVHMGYPRYEHYTFTDISAGFFGKAKEKLKAHRNRMTFSTLNIENDPLQQGFSQCYDLVLAANVHKTSFNAPRVHLN